jgi:nicotinamidase-related amidase
LETEAIERLLVVGLQARACVMATTRDALRRGYAVQIVTQAVACRNDRSRERAIRRLARKGAIPLEAGVDISH